ncbi:hypothetical protein J3R30DRAFT_3286889 [Lentinula aciculospora]|uniref:BTB domain-containing protein n=1 Tax=Lentinula aciculospora TaxID=153920 RepID=A0A9W9AG62_9AGAR|nr:hypothetical protein J3R30DRAFT_3286889 [Lentinula aciculospora]
MTQSQTRFIIYNKNTIFEPDYSDEKRPRKRARIENEESDGLAGLFRDSQYYDSKSLDACVILVGDTLFRVKIKTLSKLSLSLHILVDGTEASGDYNPVRLNAEPDEFRAVLWAVHTSPDELKHPIEDISGLKKFCSLAKFAHAFECGSQKSLALSTICDALDHPFVKTCPSPTLHLLAETAFRCEAPILLDAIVSRWIQRIQRREAPCVPAIITADALHILRLGGAACYAHLQEVAEHSITVSNEGATRFHMDPKLDMSQKVRLLTGYWSLVNYWERFRRRPLKFISCGHDACSASWERRWSVALGTRKVLCAAQVDVLGLMRIMRELLAADQELELMESKCREQALLSLNDVRKELNDTLGDHFTNSL